MLLMTNLLITSIKCQIRRKNEIENEECRGMGKYSVGMVSGCGQIMTNCKIKRHINHQ